MFGMKHPGGNLGVSTLMVAATACFAHGNEVAIIVYIELEGTDLELQSVSHCRTVLRVMPQIVPVFSELRHHENTKSPVTIPAAGCRRFCDTVLTAFGGHALLVI